MIDFLRFIWNNGGWGGRIYLGACAIWIGYLIWPALSWVFWLVVDVALFVVDLARPDLASDPVQECNHWPRTPVISDGAQVAFICQKCDVSVINEAYVRGEI